MKLDPVIIEEPRKEIGTREPQSPFKIRGKSYDFARIFIQTIFIQGRTPLDHGFLWQKTIRNEGFQVRVGALTWHPPLLAGWLRSYSLALARLLGGLPEIHRALHAHATAKTYSKDLGARKSKEEL